MRGVLKLSMLADWAGDYSVSKGPHVAMTRRSGKGRRIKARTVRIRADIVAHRERLVPIRAAAERECKCNGGLTGGPAALFVARELRKHPLSAPTYTKGDRRKLAKMARPVVETPRPQSRRQKRRAAVEEAQIIRERRHESRLHASGWL